MERIKTRTAVKIKLKGIIRGRNSQKSNCLSSTLDISNTWLRHEWNAVGTWSHPLTPEAKGKVSLCSSLSLPQSRILMMFNVICLQFFSPVCLCLTLVSRLVHLQVQPLLGLRENFVLCTTFSLFSSCLYFLHYNVQLSFYYLAKTKKTNKQKISSINSDPLGLKLTP